MIDRPARDRLAEGLRHFAAGRSGTIRAQRSDWNVAQPDRLFNQVARAVVFPE